MTRTQKLAAFILASVAMVGLTGCPHHHYDDHHPPPPGMDHHDDHHE